MGYMRVEEHTAALLHLKRSPGIRSWSLLVGIASIGLAAAYYSSDSLLWKLFYVTGCFFVALQNMDEWEEAVFDKSRGEIVLKTFSLYARILTLWRKGQEKGGCHCRVYVYVYVDNKANALNRISDVCLYLPEKCGAIQYKGSAKMTAKELRGCII
ncbi:hypothetical protein Z043_115557 [Scleropages formosus]|uniref:Essential for reactive oxygen species protein n=1 Tax=Scleropages formosus TaxID=113540 RepID=A0A0P7YGH9_SCLFO|nr:hypothetical protein Z043_115557 [Scleropages formosus]